MPKMGVLTAHDTSGKQAVAMYFAGTAIGDTPVTRSVDADAQSANNAQMMVASKNQMFNGATWDRERCNSASQLLASAARTIETDGPAMVNYNEQGLIIIISVTVDPATAAITPTLQISVPVVGSYATIWTAAAPIAAVGVFTYLFQPGGAAGSFTEAVNLRVSRDWRLKMTVADADSMTYSVLYASLV